VAEDVGPADIDPERLSSEAQELLLVLLDLGETSITVFAGMNPDRAQRSSALEEAAGAANELAEHGVAEFVGAAVRLTPAGTTVAQRLAGD
jgi:hypothetical protein